MRAGYGTSPIHVICICSNLSAFSVMFLCLSLEQLTAVAFAHHISLVLNKPALRHAFVLDTARANNWFSRISFAQDPGLFSHMQVLFDLSEAIL
jgi:hypothetical protein